MNVWMRAIIAGWWIDGPIASEQKYLAWVPEADAWHLVAEGWADYA